MVKFVAPEVVFGIGSLAEAGFAAGAAPAAGLAKTTTADGRHRALANMATRAEELGGAFTMRRSTLGGVHIEVWAPRPTSPRQLASKAMG